MHKTLKFYLINIQLPNHKYIEQKSNKQIFMIQFYVFYLNLIDFH